MPSLDEWRENYADKWPIVQRALAALRGLGIFYVDPRPGNVVFDDEDE